MEVWRPENQVHLSPVMDKSLLDCLHPVRFLPDVDQLAEDDRPPPEQANCASVAWQTVWSQALRFRMRPVPGDDIAIGLHPRGSFAWSLIPGRHGERLAGIDVRPAQLRPLPGITGVRGDEVEVLGVCADLELALVGRWPSHR